MTVEELQIILKQLPKNMEVVLNMTTEEQEGFMLCPLAKVEEIETDMCEKYLMLTGLEFHATSELANN